MTEAQLKTLIHLNKSNLPYWWKVNYTVAKMLDDAILYMGTIKVTSTWRQKGSSAASASFHSYNESYAIDFKPVSRPMWHDFILLQEVGFKRIGLSPGQGIIHVDVANKYFAKYGKEYLFFEDANGRDLGPLINQPLSNLKQIPGFNTYPVIGPIETAVTNTGDRALAALIPIGVLLAKTFIFS